MEVYLRSYFSQRYTKGGYSGEDPPLPIPNREVKLTSADDTATPSGKVGCRQTRTPGHQKMLRRFSFGAAAVAESDPRSLLPRVCPPADRYSGTGPDGYKLFGGGKLAFQSQMTQETLGGTERKSRQRLRGAPREQSSRAAQPRPRAGIFRPWNLSRWSSVWTT